MPNYKGRLVIDASASGLVLLLLLLSAITNIPGKGRYLFLQKPLLIMTSAVQIAQHGLIFAVTIISCMCSGAQQELKPSAHVDLLDQMFYKSICNPLVMHQLGIS